ncbi:MAG: general secretion pathway protein GspK, partial [Betaproteobacteria bacterium]|nr:general secretion pathway protein GspK [Betaproteobacteria bacterium]
MNALSRSRGMAMITALLIVALIATLAATTLWQQWKSLEVESAERQRQQSQWLLGGALDWARLVLREDARSGNLDHLAEPWALPLQEARLSSFLA